MDTIKNNARTAGVLYLLLVLVAPLRLVYIPNTLFVGGDIVATVANITASAGLFQLGMLADLFCGTLEVFLALALFQVFKDVDRRQAIMMVVLGLMPVPLYFVNVLTDVAVSHLLHGATPLAGFTQAQAMSLVGLALRVHDAGINALQIFWGAWLFPLAVLVMRSRFLPRFVGIWLVVNGVAYLALSLVAFAAPQLNATVSLLVLPAQLGEVVFTVCLLILGVRGRLGASRQPALSGAAA
ncbi:MAG: DUF4386 domain-containing protein [Pseudomonadota bacterium]|nr:DUF4386 domain-containing protein [Pseudomonadota bacterium]